MSVDKVLVLEGNAAFNPSQPDLGCNGTCSLVCPRPPPPSKDPYAPAYKPQCETWRNLGEAVSLRPEFGPSSHTVLAVRNKLCDAQ